MRVVAVLAGLLALAACDRGGPDRADAAAEQALRQVRAEGVRTAGMPPPANLPRYAPIAPGNFVTAVAIDARDPAGGSVEFSTTLSPPAVVDFYRRAATEGGLKVLEAEARKGSSRLEAAAAPRTLTVEVDPLEGVGSTVRLRYR